MEDLAAFNQISGIRRIRHPYARVDVARNRIEKKFCEITQHPESSVTMLDTDHLHDPETVVKLIQHNLPVVGALAFRRGEPYDPQVYVKSETGSLGQPTQWKPGVLEADIVGAAAICIRRKVFTELEEKGFPYPHWRMIYEDGKNEFLGEDWYFARICQAAGIKHHCDMTLVAPHQDTIWIDEKPWLIRQGHMQVEEKAKGRPEPWFHDAKVFEDVDRRWQELKDYHVGETCIIMGNGPSLKDVPKEFLKSYPTFGTNRVYMERIPDYYCAVNPLVLDQFGVEAIAMMKGRVRRFFLGENWLVNKPDYMQQPAVVPVRSLSDRKFFVDPTKGLYEGHTVTFVCMQIAYWMGFKTVLLVGVDHRYEFEGEPNQELVSDGDDPNHFHKHYFGKGTRWHAPDLVRSEQAYQMAKEVFEADDRRIINLTSNSALNVLEKEDLQKWQT